MRVFVAAQGSDANPCTFGAPCRTFQHAHDVVAAGGEIDVLDPAGYGAVSITKAISIQGHGFAGISVGVSVAGVMISAPATAAISLNGLLIEGNGIGGAAVQFNTGKSLVVENCVMRKMIATALVFASSATTLQTLSVSNSYFTDNGTSGILIEPHSSGPMTALIERSAFYGNGGAALNVNGGFGTGAVNVAVTDSVASNNSTSNAGFYVQSAAGHSVTSLVLTRVTASGNAEGVAATGANATLRLGQSTLTGNSHGYFISGSAVILSYGDNVIDDNSAGNIGTLGSATKQ
jgi:hypothetical protein